MNRTSVTGSPPVTAAEQFERTMQLDIHTVARELNALLGPALVASLAGSKDRKWPTRWGQPDGPEPRPESLRRLAFAHRKLHELTAARGAPIARQWFLRGNPLLGESTPILAIREDRHAEVSAAVRAFIGADVPPPPEVSPVS
jgi:hypothetical protein